MGCLLYQQARVIRIKVAESKTEEHRWITRRRFARQDAYVFSSLHGVIPTYDERRITKRAISDLGLDTQSAAEYVFLGRRISLNTDALDHRVWNISCCLHELSLSGAILTDEGERLDSDFNNLNDSDRD